MVPHLAEFGNSSFPSGHSMLASIIYLTLAALLTQTVKTLPTKLYLMVGAFLLALSDWSHAGDPRGALSE